MLLQRFSLLAGGVAIRLNGAAALRSAACVHGAPPLLPGTPFGTQLFSSGTNHTSSSSSSTAPHLRTALEKTEALKKLSSEEVDGAQAHFRQSDPSLSLASGENATASDSSSSSSSSSGSGDGTKEYLLPHPIWSTQEVESVAEAHREPRTRADRAAKWTVSALRVGFDLFSGYYFGQMTERKWINRIIFLETVAGVPGFVGGMIRHLQSLRLMKRDRGWIHTLLEEGENERMHLLTAIQVKQPGWLFRTYVVVAQGIYVNLYFLAYLVSPDFCHRLVGYLEESAVHTYTTILAEIDDPNSNLAHWKTQPAPSIAINYWRLGSHATMRDVIAAIRADEAHHRDVNHTLADVGSSSSNPFPPGY